MTTITQNYIPKMNEIVLQGNYSVSNSIDFYCLLPEYATKILDENPFIVAIFKFKQKTTQNEPA